MDISESHFKFWHPIPFCGMVIKSCESIVMHFENATEKDLKKLTLTNLYNEQPTWLDLAHRRLDDAVLDRYGWPHDIGEKEILERLLAANAKRYNKPSK